MIHGAGSFLRRQSNQSQKVPRKDIATSKDSGKAIEASGDRGKVDASEDSNQEVATKVADSKQKPEVEF